MKFISALEFAQSLRLGGNEWADEIIDALEDQEATYEIIRQITDNLPHQFKEKLEHGVEWLFDNVDLIEDLRDRLDKNGFEGVDIDDALEELLKRPTPLEYDL